MATRLQWAGAFPTSELSITGLGRMWFPGQIQYVPDANVSAMLSAGWAAPALGDEADEVSGLTSGGSGTAVQYQRFVTPGSATFTYTDATRIIYVSGCSGGGGGGGGYGGAGGGGGGGGPAPMFFMLPLELASGGGQLDLFIGSGGALGAVGGAGATGATGGDGTETTIVGHTATEILSPYANASNQILMGLGKGGIGGAAGAGGNGGGARMTSTLSAAGIAYGTENTGTAHATRWWYTADGFPSVEWMLPICQGAGGAAVSASGGSRGAGGFSTINGNGFGNSGTGNASGGGGGGGGGGPYGLGGLGGSNAGDAGAGFGYGFGGGGGSGNANGTAGGNGFLLVWY